MDEFAVGDLVKVINKQSSNYACIGVVKWIGKDGWMDVSFGTPDDTEAYKASELKAAE